MDNFNQLTNAEAERLALVAEEAAEVVQAVTKILRHGYESRYSGSSNRERLEEEIGDLFAVIGILFENGDINIDRVEKNAERKLTKVGLYLHHQQSN